MYVCFVCMFAYLLERLDFLFCFGLSACSPRSLKVPVFFCFRSLPFSSIALCNFLVFDVIDILILSYVM